MDTPATIVIYGRDLSLLETRGWVLERAGYRVCLALRLEDVIRTSEEQTALLLLLCHTLSPEQGDEVLKATAGLRPRIKNLLMTAHTVVPPSARGEMMVSAFDGPRAMVAAVGRALITEDSRL